MGMKSDGILKCPYATRTKYRKYMKIPFKMKEILEFNLYCKFRSIWTSLEKRKTNFPRLYSWSSFCCHYGISNILLHHQNVLTGNPEISVKWFLLKSMLKQMWEQGRQGKRKQMGTILLRYQPSITCNPSTFDLTEIVNEWRSKRGTGCPCVRLFLNAYRSDTYRF